MSAIGWRFRLGIAAALAAGLAVALIVLVSGGPSPADPTAASRQALAAREASALLAELPLPPGATRPGAGAADAAVANLARATATDVTVRTRTSTVSEPAAVVRAFIIAHPPHGIRISDRGLTLAPRRRPAGIAAERVHVVLLATGPHSTVVRAVAQVRRLVARSPAERVPHAARMLVITRGRPDHRPGLRLRVGGARLARIQALIDRLPTVQPGAVYHCPVAVLGLPEVVFSFRAGPRGRALARAVEDADVVSPTTACDALRFSVGGRSLTPLLGGARLLREVSAVVGRRIWLPPYAA